MYQWTLSALTSQNKIGGVSVGTFMTFVWVIIGENFLSDYISAKKAGRAQTNRYGDYMIERIVI